MAFGSGKDGVTNPGAGGIITATTHLTVEAKIIIGQRPRICALLPAKAGGMEWMEWGMDPAQLISGRRQGNCA